MRNLLAVYAGLIVVGMLLLSANTWQHSASFGIGGGLMFLNVILLVIVWDFIIRKKLVAVGLFVIVTKYAFIGLVVYQTFELDWVNPLLLSLGVGTFGLAAVVHSLIVPNRMAEA